MVTLRCAGCPPPPPPAGAHAPVAARRVDLATPEAFTSVSCAGGASGATHLIIFYKELLFIYTLYLYITVRKVIKTGTISFSVLFHSPIMPTNVVLHERETTSSLTANAAANPESP